MIFPIHASFILGPGLCLVNENYLNCTSGLELLCFFISTFLLQPYDVTTTYFFHSIMHFQLKCVRDVVFLKKFFRVRLFVEMVYPIHS